MAPSQIPDDIEPHVDELYGTFEKIERRGFSLHKAFEDWLDIMLVTFQGDDEQYRALAEKYTDRTVADGGFQQELGAFQTESEHPHPDSALADLGRAFGTLVFATHDTRGDVLGYTYETFGLTSDHFAQHFTPSDVSDLLTAMISDGGSTDRSQKSSTPDIEDPRVPSKLPADEPPDIGFVGYTGVVPTALNLTSQDPEERKRIGDISGCGSGRLLLNAARNHPNGVFYGIDIDPLCAKMTVVNLVLFGLEGVVALGDGLSMEFNKGWKIHRASSNNCVTSMDPDHVQEIFTAGMGTADQS